VIVGAKPEIQEACRLVDAGEKSFVFADALEHAKKPAKKS